MKEKNPYLLPEGVEPLHYKIELKPDLEKFTFVGSELIDIDIQKPTLLITMHALELEIDPDSVLLFYKGDAIRPVSVDKIERFETLVLKFSEKIEPGKAKLQICFSGELNDKMHGFYRTWYELEKGKKTWGAATQFESTDARRCFPCWDEPAKKATFELNIIVPKAYSVIFNTDPLHVNHLQNEHKKISFRKTPKMSTYLVAIIVAHLKCIEGNDKNGVAHRVWAVPGKEEHGRFALECSIASVEFYEKKTGISYKSISTNSPKLDMIACPDFASGAMENLGAVTYRETAALIDPANDTAAARERVAEVVEHENAHMWFGDLVTMIWWNGLWLNEGFATFMSHCAMHDKFPEWDVWTGFVAEDFRSALHLDSLKNSHPIEIDVQNPSEIREIFDAITYSKGSVVNRMLEQYLGEDFWKGLQLYLKRFSYKNADTVDLWAALEEASGKPTKEMMACYTKQPGYPVVSAKIKREDNANIRKIELTQQRFFADGSADKKNLKWVIPLEALTPEGKTTLSPFTDKTKEFKIFGNLKWIKLNPGQSGFYRVAYSHKLWDMLIEGIKCGELSAIDRIGLLDDSMALAKAGYMKTSQALDMIAVQNNDKEFDGNVWSVVISNLNAIDHILEDDIDAKERLAVFAKKILLPPFEKLGWSKKIGEKHTDILLRSQLIGALGKYKDQNIISEVKKCFEMLKVGAYDQDLKAVIYALVATNGGQNEFDELIKIYDKTDDAREKERIQVAMGSFRSETVINEVIAFSRSEKVRKQDWFRIMVMLGRNPVARPIVWKFLKENWGDFKTKYEGNLTLLVRTLEGVTFGFTDEENLADIKKFFKAHPLEEAKRTMKQVVETIETNIKWRKRALDEIKNWLEKH